MVEDGAPPRATPGYPQLERTLRSGFIFTENIDVTDQLVDLVESMYGRDPARWNNSLHKSFATVRDSSMFRLRLQQMAHYLTTYGAEFFHIYNSDNVYIPAENLDLPDPVESIQLMVIRGLTRFELRRELKQLLASGIALDERSVADAAQLVRDIGGVALADVRNHEVRCAMYHASGTVPRSPEEFLRFLLFHATGSALLIKSDDLISEIRSRSNVDLIPFFAAYAKSPGLARLSEVFLRFKPLFLAMRTNPELRRVINRVRKLAVTNHRPLPDDLLNSITDRIQRDDPPTRAQLETALREANTFRKIRLAQSLKYRQGDPDSIVHRIRNGKSFVRKFTFTDRRGYTPHIYQLVMESVVEDIRPAVSGKSIYIPEGLHYALPATAKQFTGDLPLGTYIETHEDLVAGIHWTDVGSDRIDLDLSMLSASGKIGWDGAYRDTCNSIFFSGDLTAAPEPLGASEIFRIGCQARGSWLLHVNYYNYSELTPVPFKIMAGTDPSHGIERNHVVNPNTMVAVAETTLHTRGRTLGIIISDGISTRFHFAESGLRTGRSSSVNELTEMTRNYLVHSFANPITLNSVLAEAGARFVDAASDADLDLSPQSITKKTLIELLATDREPVSAL